MSVRPVAPDDATTWLRLRHQLFSGEAAEHRRDIERFFAGTASEPLAVLVAERNGEVVGMAELSIRAYANGCSSQGVAYLEGWFVEAASRGLGIGRSLIQAAEVWGLSRGCSELASDTELENQASAGAHGACGLEEVSQIRCFRKPLTRSVGEDEAGRP